MLPDIRHLQQVAALGQYRSFGRAARALGMTQPALSKSVRVLERMLGMKLFDRGSRGVIPTAAGQLLLARAPALVTHVDGLVSELKRLNGLASGSLAVGAGFFPHELSVGPAVCRIARRHPALQLRVVLSDWRALAADVLSGRLDVAVSEVTAAEREPELVTEKLPARATVFFVRRGHPLAGATRPLALEALAPFPLALSAVPSRVAPLLVRAGIAGRVDPVTGDFLPVLTVASIGHMKQLVRETDAFGAAPHALLRDDLARGRLVELPVDAPWARTAYGIIRRRGRPATPALEAFLSELRAVESEVPPGRVPPRSGTAGKRSRPRR